MAFRARPTWNGPFGFADVCSMRTFSPVRPEFLRADPIWTCLERTESASHSGFAVKFKYPFTEETFSKASMDGNCSAKSFEMACGAFLRMDAKGKQGKVKSP